MEEWRTEKGEKPSARQHAEPGCKRNSGDDLAAQGRVRAGLQGAHIAERRSVKHRDVEAGERHERELEMKRAVVGVLIGKSEEKHDAGEKIGDVASDPERDEAVQ